MAAATFNDVQQQINQEFRCDHSEEAVVFKTYSNGIQHYGFQCVRCGAWRSVKKASLTAAQLERAVAFDEELPQRWRTQRLEKQQAAYNDLRERQNEEWWEKYDAYLRSDTWLTKRQRVLERDGGLCQACLRRDAKQVHHLTYEHVFNEPLFDLISVCEVCHEALHPKQEDCDERN